jgi:RimJ/RimL family protein N-acetyltransferase
MRFYDLMQRSTEKMKPPYFESERLILTWPTPNQIDQYYADIRGSNMFDTIAWDGPTGSEDLPNYWQNCMQIDPENFDHSLHLAIIDKKSQNYIGGTGLRTVDNNRAIIDIGYAIAPKFQGKGYGTEAVGTLVYEAFAKRGAERIFANVFAGNQSSRNVVEKLGFQFEGTQRRAHFKRGQWLDVWLLAITRPDWDKRFR